MRNGLATLVVVAMVAVLALFTLLTWQSRLLLAIYRHRSLSDVIATDYGAESEVFDLANRFLNYPAFDLATSYTKTFGPNQSVTVTPSGSATNRVLSILGRWPFATTNLQLIRAVNQSNASDVDKVEIVLAIDCSASMDSKSDSSCNGTCPSRMLKVQDALKSFLGELTTLPAAQKEKYFIAFAPFKRTSAWVPDNGSPMYPTNDHNKLTSLVNTSVWNRHGDSPLCNINGLKEIGVPNGPETNLGDSGILANSYFVAAPRTKQAYVLFTDGIPNTSRQSIACGTAMCNSTTSCMTEAVNYLKCSLAEKTYQWRPGYFGTRNPETDVYAVTVADRAENPATYDATKAVFLDAAYVKQPPYINSNANSLSDAFKSIFNDIKNSTTSLNFSRVIPTP